MPTELTIAITTFNRSGLLRGMLNDINRYTSQPVNVVVCDDGSSDDTREVVAEYNVSYLCGQNSGIAWNKNRGIYYALNRTASPFILLLDDDVSPNIYGWEREWIEGLRRFGHLNYAIKTSDDGLKGPRECSSTRPGVNTILSGAGLGFARDALAEIGYMDTRFGKYGHEHTDFTMRALRRGFGGFIDEQPFFLVIRGGLRHLEAVTNGSLEDASCNKVIYDEIKADPVYRLPWRSEEEFTKFMSEVSGPAEQYTSLSNKSLDKYIEENPDVRGGRVQAVMHWIHFGQFEGRSWPSSLVNGDISEMR